MVAGKAMVWDFKFKFILMKDQWYGTVYRTSIRYSGMVIWYGTMVWYGKLVSWYCTLVWYGTLVWYTGMYLLKISI